MYSANKYSFTSFQYKCLLFSCLVALTRTSLNRTTLNRSSKSRHPCLIPNLRGENSVFHHKDDVSHEFDAFYQPEKVLLCPPLFLFLLLFYFFFPNHEGILNFVNFFLVSIKIIMWFLPLFC